MTDIDRENGELHFAEYETAPDSGKNLHEGHREALRNRFMREGGFEHFEDHQILELLLFYANARQDTNPLAHELLDTFGSLKGVLEARPEMLTAVKGIGPQAATLISMVVPLTRVWNRCAMAKPDRIGNSREAEKYCLSLVAGNRTERFYVIALNAQCNVLGRRRISEPGGYCIHTAAAAAAERCRNPGAGSYYCCGKRDIQHDRAR